MPSVTLVPTPGPYSIGETIEVQIMTLDFPETFGFQGNLSYNSDVLSLTGSDFADEFDTSNEPSEPGNATGEIQVPLLAGTVGSGPSGAYVAATLEFKPKTLDPVTIALVPGSGPIFRDQNNAEISLDDPIELDLELNADPDAVADEATVQEDETIEIDVLDNDTDPNVDDTLSIDSFTNGDNGTVVETSGVLTYTPTANFNGTDSFTYTISDGNGGSDTATVNVTVDPVNDDPTGAVTISGTAEKGETLTASNDLADADGLGAISYQWQADRVDILGANTDTLVLGQDQVGAAITAVASYTDDDGTDESVESAATATVADVNFPIQTGTVTLVPTPGPYQIEDTIEIDIVTSAGFPVTFGFQSRLAYDADVLSLTGVVFAEEFDTNSAPSEPSDATGATLLGPIIGGTSANPSQISGEFVAATLTFEVLTTDPVTVDLLPFNGRLFVDDNDVDIDLTGPVTLDLVLNTDPDADPVSVSGDEDTVISGTLTATDVDGDTLTFALETGPSNGSVTINTDGTFEYTPNLDYNGTDSFTYEVADGNGGTATETVSITVNAVNDAPTGAPGVDGNATSGETLSAVIGTLADADGLPLGGLFYQWQADGIDIPGAIGQTLTLTDNEIGSEITVVVSYTDDGGTAESVPSDPTPIVADANEAPIAEDDTANVDEDDSVTIDVLVNDSDPDGGAPTVDEVLYRVNVGGPELPAADGSPIVWSADTGNFAQTGNSPYLTANSTGGSTFSGTSGSAHPGPIVFDSSLPIDAAVPTDLFNTERFDEDSAPEMLWQFPVDSGDVEVRLYFAELFNGIDAAGERSFDVSVEGSVPAEFNDIDQFATAGAKGAFMRSTVVNVTDGTLDLELLHDIAENPAVKGMEIVKLGAPTAGTGDLTVAIDTGPTNGTVVVNADGTITYTPVADYNGSDSFVYEITDANGATDTATVDVTVAPVNDAPVLNVADEFDFLDSASGPVFTATATDVDVGDTLTFALGGADADFFDIDPTTGAVTLSAATPPSFTIADEDIGSIADVTQNLDLIVSVSDGTETVDQAVIVNFLKDTDTDGVADASDNALFVANPDQRDTDGDGYGNIIDADLDNNGEVLLSDLFLFREAFGSTFLTDGVDVEANADFTGDGAVNAADISIFRNLFVQEIETQSLIGDDYGSMG